VITWVAAGAACVVVALYSINLFSTGQFSLGGALLGLAVGLLIIGFVAGVGAARVRSLRSRYPQAFVSNVALYDQLYHQLGEISEALGANAFRLGGRRSGSVVLDEGALRIFVGLRPRLALELPSTDIAAMGIARAPQGKWVLPSLEIVFTFQGGAFPLDICLMNSNFGFPHAVGRVELDKQLALARQACAPS
jgi:hypothetical protein